MSDDHIIVREFNEQDIPSIREIWNQVVEEGRAFPQIDPLLDDEEVSENA